jgi:hypothetical protein
MAGKYLLLVLIFVVQVSSGQEMTFTGAVKNEVTSQPISGANIKVLNTNIGTFTDKNGTFTLKLTKIPATLVISCIGFDRAVFDIVESSTSHLRFLLRPIAYSLSEVKISSEQYSAVYQDKTYSVLDYELMDDDVALLVFRNVKQRAGMVLLTRDGDTLAVSELPELPPEMLRRDFLSNVHYYTKSGNTYQCYYVPKKESIEFLHEISADSLEKMVMPYLFRINGRLYFQERVLSGFGTSIVYYSKEGGKRYVRNCMNNKKISEYLDDMSFYLRWNGAIGTYMFPEDDIESEERFDFSKTQGEGGSYGKNEARAHQFEFFNMIYPMYKLNDDTIIFFNFGNNLLEMMDPDGNVIFNAPISFHLGSTGINPLSKNDRVVNDGWRWGTKIMFDESTHLLYTMFIRSGMVMIRKIDLQTGGLGTSTIIPFPFPEKISIYKSEAFFLLKQSGTNENWKLMKCKIL